MTRWLTLLFILVGLLLPLTLLSAAPQSVGQDPQDQEVEEPSEAGEAADGDSKGDEGEEEEEKWDVNKPPFETHEVDLDVTTGTWMSLDVSPDGQEIVFDLLGDIYSLPVEGGEATPLNSGISWAMQPRFSPNGQLIAFTSDAGGGDNLWIMERDGSNPKAVSEETFRLLNSPAWSPDSEYLVGRKHFTSRRSLGAGELWLYHRSGGGGVQLTEKPNDQKDVGEPAFSPDGRFVYFSRDTTPGAFFEYSKDPNPGIYSIRKVDLENGEIETVTGGPGGAIRPTPSPDGKYLAFIRRVRYQSEIWLRDLASGEEWSLTGGLDRDLQETWAIHGVYPTMAFAPDSRSLFYWAQGHINRVDVASGESKVIPFHLKDSRTVAQTRRETNAVDPDRFSTKMLRWVTVSPQGDRAVFESLGKIWIRSLPEGRAKRLTRQEDHFELYPSFSRDGSQIAYSTWDDREMGSVRIVSSRGGEGRKVTAEPGLYTEPAFSPNGNHLVYGKSTSRYLLPPVWSAEPGLYRVSSKGGSPEKITEGGFSPHFSQDNNRLFYTRYAEDGVELVSLNFKDREVLPLVTSEKAMQLRVSPDGRWIAFQEGFNAHVAAFPATGKARSLGPGNSALPTSVVSRDTGDYLHWSGDSNTLYWSSGPTLMERKLDEAFAFRAEDPDNLPEPPEEGIHLGFETSSDEPQGTWALVNCDRVITANAQDHVVESATVVVQGSRILALGPKDDIAVPPAAETIDCQGLTVMPGLVDVHWHGGMGTEEVIPEQSWINYASLSFGVTTLHDPSNDTSEIFAAAEMARAGVVVGPRIFSTGTILYGADASFTAEIDGLDDARSHLRRLKAVGAFSVKSYNQPRRDQRQQVIKASEELGMLVVPEGGSLYQHNMSMIVDGHTGIEHSIPVAQVYEDVEQLWSATETGYTPTLGVAYGGMSGEIYWYGHTKVWANERLSSFTPPRRLDAAGRRAVVAPLEEYNHIAVAATAAKLQDLGVRVHIGAHGQREGLAAHWEMWMLHQGGMEPLEVIRAATRDGATYLGMEGDIGSLEKGKKADLMVLKQNPLEDIRHTQDIRWVAVDGRLYDADTMNAVHGEPRAPFWWELQPGEIGRPADDQ